jgi:hypothetical protein
MNAAILYWSRTGNTQKVALAIKESLEAAGVAVLLQEVEQAADVDWYAYDLLCVGFPSYQWHPPRPVDDWLKARFAAYRQQGRVRVGAPTVPGRNVLIFCTYSGPHTGVDEATPATRYAGQFFAHLGFTVLDEWCIVGEFHGSPEASTMGRMGDIRGRPNEADLEKIRQDVARLLQRDLGHRASQR